MNGSSIMLSSFELFQGKQLIRTGKASFSFTAGSGCEVALDAGSSDTEDNGSENQRREYFL